MEDDLKLIAQAFFEVLKKQFDAIESRLVILEQHVTEQQMKTRAGFEPGVFTAEDVRKICRQYQIDQKDCA